FDRYRTTQRKDGSSAKAQGGASLTLLLPGGAKPSKELKDAVALAERVAQATNWARDLVNEPAGVMTPKRLADEARKAAKEAGLSITVGTRKDIEKLKMGMFLGVAQGSTQEPQLIHVWYAPKNAKAAKAPPVALVGKAI